MTDALGTIAITTQCQDRNKRTYFLPKYTYEYYAIEQVEECIRKNCKVKVNYYKVLKDGQYYYIDEKYIMEVGEHYNENTDTPQEAFEKLYWDNILQRWPDGTKVEIQSFPNVNFKG